jgi:ribonuclease BN (tRNA processing enzyme)
LRITILGSGGGMPSGTRETACTLVRRDEHVLLLDVGTGARRLVTNPVHLEGVEHLHVLLTHFHLDHVCGLPYLRMLPVGVTIWAPGAWLYGTASAAILDPLRRPPIAPTDATAASAVEELRDGDQIVGGFAVRASPQPRHWTPSVGLRIEDELALVTDTPHEESSVGVAEGVAWLLHEAWSTSSEPIHPEHDATAADAASVARDAGVGELVLIHVNPTIPETAALIDDAAPIFGRVAVGEDELVLGA